MAAMFEGAAAHAYRDGPPRQVPGFAGLHRMAMLLMAERAPGDGRILVLGAGGGLEIDAFARAQAGWHFHGVDPSPDMLRVAQEVTADHAGRVALQQGYIEDAPDGPFDAATAILTFHFIARGQRLETLRQIRERLKPGAPLILAHVSFAQTEPERSQWIARHVEFAAVGGMDAEKAESARQAIGTRLTILAPEEEEAMLRDAGFEGVALFYAGFSFRGWVAYAG